MHAQQIFEHNIEQPRFLLHCFLRKLDIDTPKTIRHGGWRLKFCWFYAFQGSEHKILVFAKIGEFGRVVLGLQSTTQRQRLNCDTPGCSRNFCTKY